MPLAIVACIVLLALIWTASFHVTWFQRADQNLLLAFYDLTYLYYPAHSNAVFSFLVSLCDPWPYLLFGALSVSFALVRRQTGSAWAAGIVLIGANITTFALKAVLPEPHIASLVAGAPRVAYPRWPSGHSTAAMALALSIILVAPVRLRPVAAAAGAAFAALVADGLLVLGSHLPSDVLAGFLVAAGWLLIAVTAVFVSERRTLVRRHRSIRTVPKNALGLIASFGLSAGAVVLAGPHAIVAYAGTHGRFVAAALAVATFSSASCTALAVMLSDLRRSPPRG
jgi:membrane-associated phospholipid phosphatase